MPTARWMKNPATRARSGSAVTTVPSTRGRSRRVSPAIWAAIITAVRAVVATTPKSAQPAQSISAPTGPVGLGCGAGEQVGQGDRRVGDAVPVVGVAVVLHSQVVLVGVEVRKLHVCRVLAQHVARRDRTLVQGVGPVLHPDPLVVS